MKDKIQVSLSDNSECNPFQYRKVVIWGVIFSPLENDRTNLRYIEKTNGAAKDTVAWGLIGDTHGDFTNFIDNPAKYNQICQGGIDGFVMYAEGHPDIFAVSKQCDVTNGFGSNEAVVSGISTLKSNNQNIFQRWEFYIPAGKYVFRIGDPYYGLQDGYRLFSADMIGLTSISNIGLLVSEQYEIHVDCCNADYELRLTPVMIWDLTRM